MNRGFTAAAATLLIGATALAWALPAWRAHQANSDLESRLSERVPVPPGPDPACAPSGADRPLVLLVLGQSNAGNHGTADALDAAAVPVITGSGCTPASDPLPGATGRGASVWTRLPAHLQTAGLKRPVWLSLLAVDATSSDDWVRKGSPLRAALQQQAKALRQFGHAPDFVLWQQGETDARQGVPADKYQSTLRHLAADLHAAGIDAPIVLARSTVCRSEPSRPIRAAIEALAAADSRFELGPDTDALNGSKYRNNGCHLSPAGRDAAAHQWAKTIVKLVATGAHPTDPH